jgi:hypothetical protein
MNGWFESVRGCAKVRVEGDSDPVLVGLPARLRAEKV